MDLTAASTGDFTATAVHERLARLVGHWKGTAKTYADPARPDAAEEAPWEGAITSLLAGRFLRFTYASRAMGQPLAGELTIAYETGDERLRMSWIDSLHTSPAILVSEGELVPAGDVETLGAFGTYFAGKGEPRWGWRTEIDDRDSAALRLRMYNVAPGGEETLGVAIALVRADHG